MTLNRALKSIGIGLAVWAGLMYGMNQVMQRSRRYEGNKLESITVPVGFWSHESYSIASGTEYGYSLRPGNSEYITDGSIFGKEDGLVDRILVLSFGSNQTLKRDKHFETHRKQFEEADKKLADAKKRFAHYFE